MRVVVGVVLACAVAQEAGAAAASDSNLEVVTVTATRVAMSSYDIPAAISTVSGSQFKVITVRVVSKRLMNQKIASREITMSVQVINQFSI